MKNIFLLIFCILALVACDNSTVGNQIPPEIQITSPLPFERFGREEIVPLKIDCSDDVQIRSVIVFKDDIQIAALYEPPYEYNWTAPSENCNVIITAVAEDNAGNKTVSEIVPLLIDGGDPEAMILINGGSFNMGDTRGLGNSDEVPVHTVTVGSFYMAQFEVSLDLYFHTIGDTIPSSPYMLVDDRWPKIICSWQQAVEFCNLLSLEKGFTPCYQFINNQYVWNTDADGFRLPTEAEWEFAARGGSNSPDFLYSGSDDISSVAWYAANCVEPKLIGSKEPNSLQLFDMTGNAQEWCWDWYDNPDSSYYQQCYENEYTTNPQGPASGDRKVLRGGGWRSNEDYCRLSARSKISPDLSTDTSGFRVVRSAHSK